MEWSDKRLDDGTQATRPWYLKRLDDGTSRELLILSLDLAKRPLQKF